MNPIQSGIDPGSINRALAKVGVSRQVDARSATTIFGAIPYQRFWNAVALARQDPRAKRWIQAVVQRAEDLNHAPRDNPLVETAAAQSYVDPTSLHVYAGSAALTWSANVTRQSVPTAMLEAAKATGPRAYDWDNKCCVQLTVDELPAVTAVFLGLASQCEYKNHGVEHDKGFSVQHQGDKVFVRVFAKNFCAAVPVAPTDCFHVAGFLLRRLQARHPELDQRAIIDLLHAMAAMMSGR